jgi:DNA polymerase-3 subunit delta
VSAVQEQTVFEFVDALGRMQTDAALKLLHEQIENGAAPPYLMTMIVRQFRIILQMRDLQARGMPRDVAVAHIKMNPYVATKVWDQAQNFSIARLEAIYQKLLETDLAIKTSRADPVLALDTLVVELTRQPAMAR